MTTEGELFVTEDIRDSVSRKIGKKVEIDVKSIRPIEWLDAKYPAEFPDGGSAIILDAETGKPIGEVKWTMVFYVEEDIDGKYIEAGIDKLEVKLYSDIK